MKISACIRVAADSLQVRDITTSRLDAELLLAHVLGRDRTWLVAHGDNEVSVAEQQAFEALVVRRMQREPVAYLTGHKEFYGRELTVTPDVLIPRPESETIIDIVKERVPSPASTTRLLDVGTGSGCLGLTCKLEIPELSVTVSDISPQALNVARQNAKQLGTKPIRYITSDLLEHWLSHGKPKAFDIIIANLPYVDRVWETSPELGHEPELALYAEEQGLKLIKTLLSQAPTMIHPDGYLLLEADPCQHEEIIEHAKQYGFTAVETRDYVVVLRR